MQDTHARESERPGFTSQPCVMTLNKLLISSENKDTEFAML